MTFMAVAAILASTSQKTWGFYQWRSPTFTIAYFTIYHIVHWNYLVFTIRTGVRDWGGGGVVAPPV